MISQAGILLVIVSAMCALGTAVVAWRTHKDREREAKVAQAVATMEEAKRGIALAEGRLRTAEVELFLAEYEPLLENEDLDFLVSSQLLHRSSSLLLGISKDIITLSQDSDHPLDDFQELIVAFYHLEQFVQKAFTFHEKKFGLPKETTASEEGEEVTTASDEEAQATISEGATTPVEAAVERRRRAEGGVAQLRNRLAT